MNIIPARKFNINDEIIIINNPCKIVIINNIIIGIMIGMRGKIVELRGKDFYDVEFKVKNTKFRSEIKEESMNFYKFMNCPEYLYE